MQSYEKLGAFYLGRLFDPEAGEPTEDLLLYDAKDLTTHAVCVGMTGSGKTGLCLGLLEEAAIDGIPAIAIDPKGDLGNLMLTFPKLRAEDFRPWIDEAEAGRKGMSPDEFAADRAELWRKGLGKWGQDGERIARFRDAADVSIYTPGSSAGLPLSVLRSFAAPPQAVRDDADAMRERINAAVSGLLALLGIDADPIRSREHILLSNILSSSWDEGRDLDVTALIQQIQSPPFERVGVMDLESFFGAKDRFALAMSLNNLLASPGFAAWMEGEPLDVGRLLHTAEGKPRLSILSIAHLSDAERMFFVTLLLNEVVAWMRSQPGTSSLRALLYMDEIFGFFPPVANPPSKLPMLTLLKQARAYGLGVVLATQNPVDLDYKGLSNTGTWFLGRLQTERDTARVIDGLEGASRSSGAAFDRKRIEVTLAGLSSRVFLMNNVHEDEPALFHTRWALSYLRGPLTRSQIKRLMADRRAEPASGRAAAPKAAAAPVVAAGAADAAAERPPTLPPGVKHRYIPVTRSLPEGTTLLYRPTLVGAARMHYVRTGAKIDRWEETALMSPLDGAVGDDLWEQADPIEPAGLELETRPDQRGRFDALPGEAAQARSYKGWSKRLVDHLYRDRSLVIYHARKLKVYSEPGEEEGTFRVRLRQRLHEERDVELEKLRQRYASKFNTARERIRKAEHRAEREQAEYRQAGFQTAVSFGATLLGALLGRKAISSGTVGKASTTLRGAGRAARQRGDLSRAKDDIETHQERLQEMEAELEQELERVREAADERKLDLSEITIRPRKSDMTVRTLALAWAPYRVEADGAAEPAFELG